MMKKNLQTTTASTANSKQRWRKPGRAIWMAACAGLLAAACDFVAQGSTMPESALPNANLRGTMAMQFGGDYVAYGFDQFGGDRVGCYRLKDDMYTGTMVTPFGYDVVALATDPSTNHYQKYIWAVETQTNGASSRAVKINEGCSRQSGSVSLPPKLIGSTSQRVAGYEVNKTGQHFVLLEETNLLGVMTRRLGRYNTGTWQTINVSNAGWDNGDVLTIGLDENAGEVVVGTRVQERFDQLNLNPVGTRTLVLGAGEVLMDFAPFANYTSAMVYKNGKQELHGYNSAGTRDTAASTPVFDIGGPVVTAAEHITVSGQHLLPVRVLGKKNGSLDRIYAYDLTP